VREKRKLVSTSKTEKEKEKRGTERNGSEIISASCNKYKIICHSVISRQMKKREKILKL
jgi:hypothetical protein